MRILSRTACTECSVHGGTQRIGWRIPNCKNSSTVPSTSSGQTRRTLFFCLPNRRPNERSKHRRESPPGHTPSRGSPDRVEHRRRMVETVATLMCDLRNQYLDHLGVGPTTFDKTYITNMCWDTTDLSRCLDRFSPTSCEPTPNHWRVDTVVLSGGRFSDVFASLWVCTMGEAIGFHIESLLFAAGVASPDALLHWQRYNRLRGFVNREGWGQRRPPPASQPRRGMT